MYPSLCPSVFFGHRIVVRPVTSLEYRILRNNIDRYDGVPENESNCKARKGASSSCQCIDVFIVPYRNRSGMPPKRPSRATNSKTVKTEPQTDWNSKKVADLRKECVHYGLDSTGTKAVLIQRLENHLSSNDEPKDKIKKEEPVADTSNAGNKAVSTKKSRTPKPDSNCNLQNISVFQDYDCMLNQTNIGNNNNKFYIAQVLHTADSKNFWTWNRWGRVGETGQNSLKQFSDSGQAIKDFEKKFKDKTKNNWSDRDNFVPAAGKYTLIEMADDDDEDTTDDAGGPSTHIKSSGDLVTCTLDAPTKELVTLIFDTGMFIDSMKQMEIDVKKMPLGKLSKQQICKGFDTLVALEEAIKNRSASDELERLSNQFYTQIPHNFGRNRPQVLNDLSAIRAKKDMLLVLSDIEMAQALQKEKQETMAKKSELDIKYESLECSAKLLDPNVDATECENITKYFNATSSKNGKIEHIWRIDRHDEDLRYSAHDDIKERKLLWHGTNIAVIAAILKSGLRIMPHSGGRVGKGIYLASENSKSFFYASYHPWKWLGAKKNIKFMFLAEAALGKEHHIIRDDGSLKRAPPGYNSVVAKGFTEPDSKYDVTMEYGGKNVCIPLGAPIKQEKFSSSSFSQSEYLVYQESQVRLRYLLCIKV